MLINCFNWFPFRNRKWSKLMQPSSCRIVCLSNGRENRTRRFLTLWIIQSHLGPLSIDVPTDFPNVQMTIMTLATSNSPQSSLFYHVHVSVLIFIPVKADQSGVCSDIIWYSSPDVVKHFGVISIPCMELNVTIILWANTSALQYYSTLKDTATG